MSARARRPRWLVPLLLALALHLLGAALVLLLRSGDRPRSASAVWQELDLVHTPAPRADQPNPLARSAREPVQPQAAARSRQPARRRSPEPTAPPTPAPIAPMDLGMRGLDLSPSPGLFAAERPPDPGGKTLRTGPGADRRAEAARVKQRIDGWLKRDAGRRNAHHGRVHPALIAVLQRARQLFSPTEQTVPARLRHSGKEVLRAYRAGIDTYNRMGRALPFDYQDYGQEVTPPVMLEGMAEIARGVADKGLQHRFTEICIAAAPTQRPEVSSQRSSGIKALDRQARSAMDHALARVMPADMPRTAACYRFGLAWGRSLPTPSLSYLCGQLFNPGGTLLRYGVRLEAAWPE